MNISLQPIAGNDSGLIFSVVKRAIFEHVDSVFGWDEAFQLKRLEKEYKLDWFYWLYDVNQRIGLICYKQYGNAFHVHFLIIFPEYQGQSYGQKVMRFIHRRVISEPCQCVTLSSFSCNKRALAFYSRLGYQIKSREEHFTSMVWYPK
ncbi:GNAT family N-acetyltransferase [uncultured Vibrio sp.]|uniref:GNAT family N-acetyltransferase n=1 Tax=uncultured Vibrio sp. TaxID=114054 RepID=UPI00091AFA1E|nr:GNAT family N-acetyltransferase [uncultured Vibrio sp.]OIQ26529.1 MAG: hypothetical protein BM561_01895 [Vibrio sp. MedPE-SWchi]